MDVIFLWSLLWSACLEGENLLRECSKFREELRFTCAIIIMKEISIDCARGSNRLIFFPVKRCARIFSRRERAGEPEMAAAFALNVVP